MFKAPTAVYTKPFRHNEPSLRPIITDRGARVFELIEDWAVPIGSKYWLTLPAGTRTNYSTVPWFLRWAISQTDPVISIPSIVHDYLVGEYFNSTATANRDEFPKVYYFDERNEIKCELLYPIEGYKWIESARILRDLALTFDGNAAKIKAEVCYFFIRLVGVLRGYK